MASVLSEEQFRCIICQDIFNNPVSIPCGHNFCLECIKKFWKGRHKTDCPLCKEVFLHCPELRVNAGFREITEHFKRSLKSKSAPKPVPAKRSASQKILKSEVTCDICHGYKLPAVQSCLVCQESYCETHLIPHLRDPTMMNHRLTAPTAFITSRLCRIHNKQLDMFCKRDQTPVCMKCTESEHKHHEVIHMDTESKRVKTQMKKTQADFEQMIEARIRKTREIKNSVEMSKLNKERELQASAQVFTMMIGALERNQALLVKEIEQKQEEVEKQAVELLNELGREISELQRRHKDMQYLVNSEDPQRLLQSFPGLSSPPSTRDWSEVRVSSSSYIGTLRRSLSKLMNVCHDLEKKLSAEELSQTSRYAVDVTLDPTTAAGWLDLSPDGKKVSLSCQPKRLPDHPRRFDACVSVLGTQSFTSGRCYWVVQVGDKTDWDLGVAKESINRKGAITVRPDNGYWAICRRKGGSLSACAGPAVTLQLDKIPLKVSVFLDYEEGVVSFYNTDAKTHIYTYSGCTFTEPLYPYFNPCLHDNGKNTAPLVICAADVSFTEDVVL